MHWGPRWIGVLESLQSRFDIDETYGSSAMRGELHPTKVAVHSTRVAIDGPGGAGNTVMADELADGFGS